MICRRIFLLAFFCSNNIPKQYVVIVIGGVSPFNPKESKNCTVVKTNDDKMYANCFQTGVFPDNLGDNIQILNLTSSTIHELKENDFKSLSNLEELDMSKMVFLERAHVDTLMPLSRLKILNLSGTRIMSPPIKLPSGITHLYINELLPYNSLRFVDFSNLAKLEVLSLRGGDLQNFPLLNKSAPLVSIDLSGNPIATMKYDDLAYFCRLKQFSLKNISEGEQFDENCCEVRLWLTEFDIESDLKCGKECEGKYSFSEKSLEIRNECMEKYTTEQTHVEGVDMILNICMAVALILAIGYLIFRYYRSHAVRGQSEDSEVPKDTELDIKEELEEEQDEEEIKS